MDGGAWWAAVHGVATSWAQLSDFTFTFPFPALEKEMATHSSVLRLLEYTLEYAPVYSRTPVFLPGESQGQGSLVGFRLWGCTELDTTEAT